MITPRQSTLGEEIFRDIDKNPYLNEIYNTLLVCYSNHLLNGGNINPTNIPLDDALRFADLLSKSADVTNSEKHRAWAQEMVALLTTLFPDNQKVAYYASSVLSTIGNYRGLQLINSQYNSTSFWDALFADFDMEYLAIPYQQDCYFFHSQKSIFNHLDDELFSYSGPTSMGKSLLMRTFIKEKIASGQKSNFAILVPTKALISEITSNLIRDLKSMLEERNYKVVNSAGALALQQDHNFIFVLTPERLLYLLISLPNININYLFIDEAHKISAGDSRSAFYYKVVDMLAQKEIKPHIIFASPNIPNPEVYLKLLPDPLPAHGNSLATSFSPVSQLKYFADFINRSLSVYNDHTKRLLQIASLQCDDLNFIRSIARKENKQSIVYCHSRDKTIEFARAYAQDLQPKNDPELDALAKEIRNEIHDTYFLAELITKGVAYHVSYLPTYIRASIEKCFRSHKISILFCTSTLVEGVNLPADNLFVMSYKNGHSNFKPVDFRNLIGRVGRIEYNLYGNVFLMYSDERLKREVYKNLIEQDIPEQQISLASELTTAQKKLIVDALVSGNLEFIRHPNNQSEESYSLMRKFGLILLRDITKNRVSVVYEAFREQLTPEKEAAIRTHFLSAQRATQPDDDINISADQTESLSSFIKNGAAYPALNPNRTFDYDALLAFLNRLAGIFKWEKYESHKNGCLGVNGSLSYYAVILSQWMEGYGLKQIIDKAIEYKRGHPGSNVSIHGRYEYYNDTRTHKNAVIAETLSIIENTILFSLANYFLRFSTEYKKQHKIESFDNDWYEFVEYGSTNPLTILLQRNGFSRETSDYIRAHRSEYVVNTKDGPKLRLSLQNCSRESVKLEVADIIYNSPELFIE